MTRVIDIKKVTNAEEAAEYKIEEQKEIPKFEFVGVNTERKENMWSTVRKLISLRAKKPKEEHIEPKAVDAEPVIRCEECNKNGKVNCPMAYWDMETGEITWWNKPGEYCSRAERKEE